MHRFAVIGFALLVAALVSAYAWTKETVHTKTVTVPCPDSQITLELTYTGDEFPGLISNECFDWPETVQERTNIQETKVLCNGTELAVLQWVDPFVIPAYTADGSVTLSVECWAPIKKEVEPKTRFVSLSETACSNVHYQGWVQFRGNVSSKHRTDVTWNCSGLPDDYGEPTG